jgi:hypothetical protein
LPEEQDEHGKLRGYVVLLVMGLIVLVTGLSTLPGGWATALLGAGLSAVGGFEAKITYNRIQHEENNIRAKQIGRKSGQVNQTSPVGSPAIGKARDVYILGGEATETRRRKEAAEKAQTVKESDEQFEWLCNGDIHVDTYQEFEASVKKGDRIEGHLESKEKICLEILSRRDYDALVAILVREEGEEYDAYYSSPTVTKYDFSWVSTVSRPVMVVITGGPRAEQDDDFSAQVTARIKVVRKDSA